MSFFLLFFQIPVELVTLVPAINPGRGFLIGLGVLDNSPKHCLVLFSPFEIKLISGKTLFFPVFALSFQNFPFRVLES